MEKTKTDILKIFLIALIVVLFTSGLILAILGYQSSKDISATENNTQTQESASTNDNSTKDSTTEELNNTQDEISDNSIDADVQSIEEEINSIDDANLSEDTLSDSEIGL